jgi:hypothetical protein
MVTVPALMPVTTPVAEPTVATAGLLLLQVPAPEVVANKVVLPTQTFIVPVIGAIAATVTKKVAVQPAAVV